jgi:hypothetical protein
MAAAMIDEMSDERLHWHMENWSVYMRNDQAEISLVGFPNETLHEIFENGVAHTEDSKYLAQAESDLKDAIAMDAIIDSIGNSNPYLYAVIYVFWGFQMWTEQPKETDYPDACALVKALAKKRGIV